MTGVFIFNPQTNISVISKVSVKSVSESVLSASGDAIYLPSYLLSCGSLWRKLNCEVNLFAPIDSKSLYIAGLLLLLVDTELLLVLHHVCPSNESSFRLYSFVTVFVSPNLSLLVSDLAICRTWNFFLFKCYCCLFPPFYQMTLKAADETRIIQGHHIISLSNMVWLS